MMLHFAARSGLFASFTLLLGLAPAIAADAAKEQTAAANGPVSYYKQIRPIFQAHCQGCHQPAKARGEYVMTSFDKLLAGGESGTAAIVPKQPSKSHLIEQITPKDGKAKMPQGKKPLDKSEIDMIQRWIAQGAVNDTPANAVAHFDMEHPPVYTRQPVVTSLDFSPDGKLLAIAGFHEVLLWSADGTQRVGRLVGLADRIQSVRFSPDGRFLAVTGGLPARMGEVQVWDVAKRKLKLSVPVTYDTVYGASWAPDGKTIGFGCADNTVRAINAETGEQVLYQGSHTDWVLDTVFSKDGSHVVSVGRDMTVKLTELATQRFIDNVTSITPGVLKGGIMAVARHPKIDLVVAGGSDGDPKVYRIFRETKREIGDDANLVCDLFPMPGRVFSVRFSADGKRIAAGSSLDGHGEILVCSYDYDTDVPANIKAIMGKVPGTRTPEQRKALEDYKKNGVKLLQRVPVPQSSVYAVAFRPDGKTLAAAGADGTVRLIDPTSGKITKSFAPAPVNAPQIASAAGQTPKTPAAHQAPGNPSTAADIMPSGVKIVGLEVQPATIELANPFAYVQLVVSARLSTGELLDATRFVQQNLAAPIVSVSRNGFVAPVADGQASLQLQLGGQSVSIPVRVSGQKTAFHADFIRDVTPVLSRVGCNQGTCHGAAKGKNGFKLSLRGYDPLFDVRALTDDLASRRVNVASPDDSMMLLKPTGAVPHVGGQLFLPDDPYYHIIRNWIADGAKLNNATPRVSKIDIAPANPIVQHVGSRQQMRVLATYADGKVRDVTREAYLESGNTDVAAADRGGLVKAARRGEAPLLARFEGAYAATTLTVMGERSGFVWQQPPAYNHIDELAAAKWKRMKIEPSDVCTDAEFLRRAYLDLTGLPPSADDLHAFLNDGREPRVKREDLVDRLIGSDAFVDYWTNKWADLLEVNRKFLGTEGAATYRKWIRHEVAQNTPYDQFVRKILTASGSNLANPPASYYKILREPDAIMENTTHLFLGVRFNCNKCHDHPFERWTQDQYYQTAAFFARVDLKADPMSAGKEIGKTAVERGKPLYEIISDKAQGEVKHERTGQVTPPKFPFSVKFKEPDHATRRQELAAWISSKDNPYFAKSYVNRLWGYLFGRGIIEPIDDIRAGNPPSNPELLDYLTYEFIHSGFNVRHVMQLICKSRTYQLSIATNPWNDDDKVNYSHAMARRLPAEVLYDTVYRVTGAISRIPGVPPGTRAAALPDSGIELPSGFLATFGRPARESACECERSSGLQLGPVMALVNGKTIADAIDDSSNEIAKLVAREPDDARLVSDLFLRILNRPATPAEIEASLKTMRRIRADHDLLVKAYHDREKQAKPIHDKREQERRAALVKAKMDLAVYEKTIAPRIAEQERQKAEKTKRLEADLKKYEASHPARVADWEKKQNRSVTWVPIEPTKMTAKNGATLTRLADGSIMASGKNGSGTYTIVAKTDLRGITGIRLEVLPDPKLPRGGPGRAADGNFVLNEIALKAGPKGKPKEAQKVTLQKPLADFSQQKFPISQAIDGVLAQVNGWAVSPSFGVPHWATFECKQPIGFEGGTMLTFTLYHQFNQPNFMLGRFRLSVTTAKQPIGLSLTEELAKIVNVPAAKRTPAQQAELLKYFRSIDPEIGKRQKAIADSKRPLPIDPKLREMRAAVDELSKPTPEDSKLVQLRQDVAASTNQIGNLRLTGAQDLAWSLINTPAFLFNR